MKRPPVSVGSLLAMAFGNRAELGAPARRPATAAWDCCRGDFPPTLPGVKLVYLRLELLVDDVALDLEGRGQLPGLLREVAGQDLELLDLLDGADLAVDLVYGLLDLGQHL